ncbi:MAG: type I DNA topoisomerase [Thermodesulfovibrionales bacterium]|nr:type I DNA topoisomerase [Thermodesulfovibrionales bacterium]
MKSLVIVESPAKAKTISKILGKDFKVKASIGHVRDLPQKEMGIDLKNNYTPKYVLIPGKEKIVRELKADSKDADNIYLATDPDREGEAIAYHIAEEIKGKNKKEEKSIYRVTFHEITSKAVKEAISHPSNIDLNKVEAQQARRILDRLVGYELSPFLWKKVRRGLSAGRVQTVALKLIVERENEINQFVSEEYWTIEGLFTDVDKKINKPFKTSLYKYEGSLVVDRDGEKKFLIKDESQANEIAEVLKKYEYTLNKVEKKLRKRSPQPPFITSTLQQEAANKLKFPAKKTMMVAQQLYEGIELGSDGAVGLITYMRTDSFRVSPEAQQWARDYIVKTFGMEYVPEELPRYKSKDTAQDAHEAIRPTYEDKTPDKIKQFLTRDQYNLYKLIWNRFIASQMSSALFEQTTFIINPEKERKEETEFRATGSIVRFMGFMAVYNGSKDENDENNGEDLLPDFKEGEHLTLFDLLRSQHFTQPPPRYSEATLVRALEERGIGRPSTYATILSTIQDRKYTAKEEGRFKPTELGVIVSNLLDDKFPEIFDYQFTAKMEDELDEIESSKLSWVKVIDDFYKNFHRDLQKAKDENTRVKPEDIPTDEVCEKCGKSMVIRWGRHGRFYACSGFPDCKNTKPLEAEPKETEVSNQVCEKCGSPMNIKNGRYGRFLACSNYPTCKNAKPFTTGIKCPLDKGEIVERKTKKGKLFWSCSNYPNCRFASWNKPLNESCPKCNGSVLFEKTSKDGSITHFCPNKECKYKKIIQEND